MTSFGTLVSAPPVSIFALLNAFKESTHPKKVNLTVGAYRDERGKPRVLECVRQAEAQLVAQPEAKEYLPIIGLSSFHKAAQEIMFGADLQASLGDRLLTVQSLSGTGAVRLALDFLKTASKEGRIAYVSDPTWGNHHSIVRAAGLVVKKYRYYDQETDDLCFDDMCQDLQEAPNGSIIVLHGCAHNPTGKDASEEQWDTLAKILLAKQHVPFFDVAYQGYVTGSPETDGAALRKFAAMGIDLIACQSFSKTFGLYCERVGACHIIVADTPDALNRRNVIQSQLEALVRANYSNPPAHGARIVTTIWEDPVLRALWYKELGEMASRIVDMRTQLRTELERIHAGDHAWPFVTDQRGMFCYTGLTAKQVDYLIQEKAIYMTAEGRISIAGLNEGNVAYVAESFAQAIKHA